MIEFIALFFPAGIALALYDHLKSSTLSVRNTIFYYATFNVLINLISFAVVIYIFGNSSIDFSDSFFVRYVLMASVLGIVLAMSINAITTAVDIKVSNNGKKR